MKSMTGFGSESRPFGGGELEVMVRSVNGRYLEVRAHLPRKYLSLEKDVIQLCKTYFFRGTVDIHFHFPASAQGGDVEFRTDLAKEWIQKAKKAFKDLKLDVSLSSQDILSIPQFVQWNDMSGATSTEKKKILQYLDAAIKKCLKERAREGDNLRKICLGYMADLKQMQSEVSKDREVYAKEITARSMARFEKVFHERLKDINEDRYLQEIALLVEKSDIEEELLRFSEHVKNVEKILKSDGQSGKTLDFYSQELLREVNTIGSKSQYATITEKVVALKGKIEQFREQVQNIE